MTARRIILRSLLVASCAATVAVIAAYTLLDLMAPAFTAALSGHAIDTVAGALLWAVASMPPVATTFGVGALVGAAVGFFVELP